MSLLVRFGISMEKQLLSRFDRAIQKKGYPNRSEAIRDLIRDYLVSRRWQLKGRRVVGTLTLVYDHHTPAIEETLTEFEHQHHQVMPFHFHVHLARDKCLEVMVMKGRSETVQRLADKLINTKGVKHGKLVMAAGRAF